uniref:5-hydroxytryptamine receptor 3A n=1 Tax=Xenopus tropicalis TaxID=8364 RepID=A0A6I8QXY6_XENTR
MLLFYGMLMLCLIVSSSVQETWSSNSSLSASTQLYSHLFKGYNKGLRPVKNWRNTITVYIDVTIYAVLNVDEKNQLLTTYIWYSQSWTDEHLKWNPEMFDDLKAISIPTNLVWVPDIVILELVDPGKSPEIPFAYLMHDGTILNTKPMQVMTTCNLIIYYFPFDVQKCNFTFTSWIFPIRELNISLGRSAEEVKKDRRVFKNNGEWDLLYVLSKHSEFKDLQDNFGMEILTVVIRRRPFFYVVNLIIPSAFLMALDILGFYQPPESGERISFKITLLLGYSVFLIIVSDNLPVTSTGTPLIGIYFIVCMALLVISVAESIFIIRINQKQHLQPEVPKWIERLVLEKITALLCIKNKKIFRLHKTCSSPTLQEVERTSTEKLVEYNLENVAGCNNSTGLILPMKENRDMLDSILQEVISIRKSVENSSSHDSEVEWLQIAYVLDILLFRMYLVAVFAYFLILGILWSNSQKSMTNS